MKMQTMILCYLPLKNGLSFTAETWGMVEQAQKLALENTKMVAVVVHAGVKLDELDCLPFDEVYHVKLDMKKWKVSNYHVHAFRRLKAKIHAQKGMYLFSSHPLYHEIAVRTSTLHQAAIITNAMEVTREENNNSSLIVKREVYREKAHEFMTFAESNHQYLTFENSILYGKPQQGKPNVVQEIHIGSHVHSSIEFLSESQMDWKELKITEARCVIGIGRGVYGGLQFESILQLAEILNAPIGGSKVADELGLIPREKRIGSSGNSIDADIYVAIGISGSSQHLEGIKGVKHVIAINNDPAAAIFQRCDIGIIGNYAEVIPQLVQSLQTERRNGEYAENLRIG
ncbi:electron transfer flavoprotein subunit alpha/FixB family protein [Ammoniphilus sp. 3BR4]|uniref:electron transfer flavoprotein subunit alpha/FixB family protein n=1 Tax=Ammoniphilus sp. 3BR4 TaxID=3158265 RepID=UPI0034667F00